MRAIDRLSFFLILATLGFSPAALGDLTPNCPLQGDAKVVSVQQLNVLKNRDTAPGWADFDPTVTLPAVLAPGDDQTRWSNDRAATVTGYVVEVKRGSVETVNCHATAEADQDTHIGIALTPGAPETQWMIVEVTPRWRQRMDALGVDWGTETLKAELLGHRVTITGWLLFDKEHIGQAQNTAPTNSHDWRATAWEIHPITWISYAAPSAPNSGTAAAPTMASAPASGGR